MEDQGRDLIFALDIGTRSIIGIVGRQEGDRFQVMAAEQVEHPKRAMIDGQIEDINQVAKVAGEVKKRLEENLDTSLRRVSVAAAGRALKTCTATFTTTLSGTPITPQFVYELENSAVNEARRLLDRGEDNAQYYCVGHSVVRYMIDGYPFTNLIDHNGDEVQVEIIATFLPTEVVTSLRRCMELVELDIDVLTLEPIAAMRAVLPADVRLLNLAMVDIGAGTADIALTRDGTVSGYTMATVAGDEITEAIIRKCLVDFETAETIKLALLLEEEVTFKDILGHEQKMATKEILESIEISVELLAKAIADRIEEANGGSPMAVFLVGGGSRTPALCEKIADKLALEEDKVAVAGTNFSSRVLNTDAGLDSPEYATPVGIALAAAYEEANGGASVEINGKRVRLYTSEASSVMDALLIAGYSYSDLMGRNGRSVTFTLNGQRKVVRGGQYSVAEISLNGKPASLTSPVKKGDSIEIEPASPGEDAEPHIADFSNGALPLAVTLNGSGVKAGLLAFLNGTPVSADTPIGELDEVEISRIETVGELCRSYGADANSLYLTRNKEPASPDTILQNGDAISTTSLVPEPSGATEDTPPPDSTAPADNLAAASAPTSTLEPAKAVAEEMADTAKPPPAETEDSSADTQEIEPAFSEEPEPVFAPPADDLPDETQAKPAETTDEANTPTKQAETIEEKPEDQTGEPADEPVAEDAFTTDEGKTDAQEEDSGPAEPMASPPEPADPTPQPDPAVHTDPNTADAGLERKQPPAEPEEALPTEEAAPPSTEAKPPSAADGMQPPSFPGSSLRIELNGKTVVLPPKAGDSSHFLLDMLPLVDIDPHNPQGKVLIRRNGAEAAYLDELATGDSVEIRWENEVE